MELMMMEVRMMEVMMEGSMEVTVVVMTMGGGDDVGDGDAEGRR